MSLLTDASPNNFKLTKFGNTVVNRSIFKYGGGSAYFDGSGDCVSLNGDTAFAFGTGDFTIEFWAYVSDWSSRNIYESRGLGEQNNRATIYVISNTFIFYNAGNQITSNSKRSNQWYHVAVCRASGTTRMFIDGVQEGGNYTDSTNYGIGINRPLIAAYEEVRGDGYFNGYIDDLRVTKGVARYTSNFTPPTAQLPNNSAEDPHYNNVSLLLNFNPIVDSSTNNFTPTEVGHTKVDLQVKKYGNGAGYFDGTGDYLTFPANDAFNFGTGSFTVEAWIYLNSIPIDFFIISGNSNGAFFFGFRGGSGNNKIGWGRSQLAWDYEVASGVTTAVWYHVAVVRSGTQMMLFVNGNQVGTTQTNSTSYDLGAGNVSVGAQNNLYFLNGYIDDLRVTKGVARYGTFIPPQQEFPDNEAGTSLLLHLNSNFADSSPNNFTVTPFGNVQISTSIKRLGSGSAFFDGSGDYLTVTDSNAFNFGTGNWTVEFWVYPLSYGGTTAGGQLFGTVNGTSVGYSINLGQDINSFRIISNARGTWADDLTAGSGNGPALNQWSHMAAVRDGTNLRIYKNGIMVATTTINSSYNYSGTVGVIGFFDDTDNNFRYFNGYLDELRVTKGVARYIANFTPPTAELPDPSDPQLENVSLLLKGDGTNGSTVFRDISKNNHVLTTFGNTNINTSVRKFGTGSAYFDGSGDYISLSASNAFNFFNTNYTVEMWVYSAASQTGSGLISTRLAPVYSPWELQITSSNKIGFLIRNGGSTWYLNGPVAGNTTIPQNQWTHIAWVCNGSNTTVYVNGVADSNLTNLNTPILESFAQPSNIYIGKGGDGDFNGYIDDLRITKGVARYTSNFIPHTAPFQSYLLTPFSTSTLSENLLAFWKFSDLKDSSNNRNNLINTGNVQFVAGKIGNCAQFNGNNTLVSNSFTPTFNAAQPFSVAFWANPTSNVLGTTVGAQGNSTFNIHNNSNGSMSFNNAANADVSIGGAFEVGVWKHYVCIVSGGRNKVYINGVLVYNQPSNVSYNATSTTIGIGRYPGGSTLPFQGLIDSVGIWQKELTQSEVNELYNSGTGLEP
jgi:hypothetical protein